MDSNGTIDLSRYPELMEICDGVMLDVKSWDGGVFHALTGGENDTVKQNLRYLYDTGKLEEVRIVCLPGYVDAEATVDGIADTLGDVSKVFLKLIRFRPFGVRGIWRAIPAPSMAFMNRLKARCRKPWLPPCPDPVNPPGEDPRVLPGLFSTKCTSGGYRRKPSKNENFPDHFSKETKL